MCVNGMSEARQKDRDSARLCCCACVRAHLTACPCLRGLIWCIFNIRKKKGGKCGVGGSVEV